MTNPHAPGSEEKELEYQSSRESLAGVSLLAWLCFTTALAEWAWGLVIFLTMGTPVGELEIVRWVLIALCLFSVALGTGSIIEGVWRRRSRLTFIVTVVGLAIILTPWVVCGLVLSGGGIPAQS